MFEAYNLELQLIILLLLRLALTKTKLPNNPELNQPKCLNLWIRDAGQGTWFGARETYIKRC